MSSSVISRDGTSIAFEQAGQGPALILVAGALNTRADWSALAALLAPHFSVLTYDRRGRGESGDSAPYALEREIEDIEALIEMAAGSAGVFGHSSGAALALEAAVALGPCISKLALYEAPYNDDPGATGAWGLYIQRLTDALAAGRQGDALALFLQYLGMSNAQLAAMRRTPAWAPLEALAPTLAYDHTAILGPTRVVPVARAARVQVPALVMNGDASYPFMYETARTLSAAMPSARLLTLERQGHGPAAEVLAPVLQAFFLD
ncbi:MAG TPA: alpha/beta hydrolase [Ktedonobacteraceae bacterium]|jgi:pimeloyl-ACP methyl ester carboxylesterase